MIHVNLNIWWFGAMGAGAAGPRVGPMSNVAGARAARARARASHQDHATPTAETRAASTTPVSAAAPRRPGARRRPAGSF